MTATIKGMRMPELIDLIEETIKEINAIHDGIKIINEARENAEEADSAINNDSDGILLRIRNSYNEIDEKLDKIRLVYSEISEDGEEKESIKTQLRNLVKIFEQEKIRIEEFKKDIWGYKKKSEEGAEEKVKGLFDNINEFHEKQKEKYDEFYKRIEKELSSGVTTIRLAKIFQDKVKKYNKSGIWWSVLFVLLIFAVSIYYGTITFFTEEAKSIEEVWLHILFRAPFLIFVIWLAVFFGNRRAESKKLEESYKHKEVMARAYTGYKESIKDLDDEDNTLLKTHMENLLNTMNNDSGAFLDAQGDKHPISDLCSRFFERKP